MQRLLNTPELVVKVLLNEEAFFDEEESILENFLVGVGSEVSEAWA